MGEKQLDFNAPLLSVRRIAAKTESKPKTVRNPGFIPFTWEQTPGKSKGTDESKIGEKKLGKEEDDDGIEMFSPNASFSDCSVSGCSGSFDDVELSQGFSKNPEVRELMMDRFLHAAMAMATGPLEISLPKDHQRFGERRSMVPLPCKHRPVAVSKLAYDQEELESYDDEDEGEEKDYKGAGHFSRARGLIPRFCLKSSFLLLNPVPGMRNHGSLAQAADEESWDEALEDGSKLTSESNQLTYWSDSQTIDGSSYHRSPQSSFYEGKGSVGDLRRELKGRKTLSFDCCEKIGQKYGKISPLNGEKQRSGSMSPSTERTPSSKSGSVDAVAADDKNSGVVVDGRRIEDNPVPENCEKDELQSKIYEPVEAGLSSSSKRSNREGRNCGNDGKLALEVEDKEKNGAGLALSLLPLPLPKSPSESWLQRTLPSISSKYPSAQSLLGIQVQHRKQASWGSPKDFREIKGQSQQTRFAQVLTKPAVPKCEP